MGLLRAINVGGNNKLAMKDLVAVFVDAGCEDVRTYIQSGNVVFTAKAKVLDALPRTIPASIQKRFDIEVPLVLRSADELRVVLDSNPFTETSADPNSPYVAFLRDKPTKGRVSALDPKRSPGDEFVCCGREIYLKFGRGAGQTKLTNAWFDTQLGTVSTMRNWRTVRTLWEMAAS